jgi:hypothetical protein
MAQTEVRNGIIWVIEPEGEWPLGIEPEITEIQHQPESLEQKITRLEQQNLVIMEALATIYEENLALKAIVEGETTV